jgi:two-component system, NarL family, nitrate/nitrite response regulator NarL
VVVDLADAPANAALRADLHGAVAFPAVREDDVHAVLEFYSRERLHPTEALLRSLTGMGHELGHFHGELHPPELTAREREILQLAPNGMSVKAIAHELTLSPSTIKTHYEHIYAKWGFSDRTAAVAEALRDG